VRRLGVIAALIVALIAAVAIVATGKSVLAEFDGWARSVPMESVELDAFENPNFDDAAKYGRVNDIAEIGRYGVNGNGGLRIRSNGPFTYHLKLKARLEKGDRYVFTADIRGQGRSWGKAVMDAMFVNPSRYAGGCGAWHSVATDRGDGWKHFETAVVAKHEPEKMDYTFMIWGDCNSNEWVDVDNVGIRLDVPVWYLSNTWPVHNLVHADEGRVRLNSSFSGPYLEKDSKAVYGCRLVTADGCLFGEAACEPDANGNFTADFGKLGYEGPARLEVTLYDRTHRLNRGSRTIKLTVRTPERNRRLFVREDGVVLKDGKPFMPLGFYTGLADADKHDLKDVERHLKRLHEAGFDTIMDYQSYSLKGARRDAFYALCEKYGIYMIADDFKEGDFKTIDAKMEQLRKAAKELTAYPSIIGFYTMDEGPENAVGPLSRMRRMLNEVAPGCMVNICNINRTAPYLPAADIAGGDDYPITKGASTLAGTHARVKEVAGCAPAAIWYAPQCYNWARMVKGRKDSEIYRASGREPTEHEMLSVALCMAADGVTGFLFYAYFDLIECPVPEWRESRWKSMCEIAKVMRALEPFIMSGEKRDPVAAVDTKAPVHATALSDGAGKRIVIVCGLGKEHESEVIVPPEFGELKSRFGNLKKENGKWIFRGKDFTCDVLE